MSYIKFSHQCRITNLTSLPSDIYITACGGTKLVGQLASLFLGQKVRPLVLLDGDEAGRSRQNALMAELYVGHDSAILMLDSVLGRPGEESEIEDILGESIVLPALNTILGKEIVLTGEDRRAGSLPKIIKAAAKRQNIDLPEGWKVSVAIQLVSEWAEKRILLPKSVLEMAETLFKEIIARFASNNGEHLSA